MSSLPRLEPSPGSPSPGPGSHMHAYGPVTTASLVHKSRKYVWQDKFEFHLHVVFYPSSGVVETIVFGPATQQECRVFAHIRDFYRFIDLDQSEQCSTKAGFDMLKLEAHKHVEGKGSSLENIIEAAITTAYIIHRIRVTVNADGKLSAYIAADIEGNIPITDAFVSNTVVGANIPGPPEAPHKSYVEINRTTTGATQEQSSTSSATAAVSNVGTAHSVQSTVLALQSKESAWEKILKLASKLFLESPFTDRPPSSEDRPTSSENTSTTPAAPNAALNPVAVLNIKRRLTNFRQSVVNRSPRANKAHAAAKQLTTGFHKFKHDDELLSESLSFLHICDMMTFQAVCKKWQKVLSDRIRLMDRLTITAVQLPQYRINTTIPFTRGSYSSSHNPAVSAYVTTDTILRILKKEQSEIEHLEIDKIVLDYRVFQRFCQVLGNGRVKRLSVGFIKVSPDTLGKVLQHRNVNDNNTDDQFDDDAPTLPPTAMDFITGSLLRVFLERCGCDVAHLELSISIRGISSDFFSRVPKLRTLVPLHVNFTERIYQERGTVDGTVDMYEYIKTLQNIQMPELLQMMRDAGSEALALTDTRGNILVANEGFERLTQYTAAEAYMQPFDKFLGKLTDETAAKLLRDTLRRQKKPCETKAIFYARTGLAFLAQAVVIPNVADHKGLLLGPKSLSIEFLLSLINEEDAGGDAREAKTIREWLATQKTLKYTLVRFGALSEHFTPNKLAQRTKVKI